MHFDVYDAKRAIQARSSRTTNITFTSSKTVAVSIGGVYRFSLRRGPIIRLDLFLGKGEGRRLAIWTKIA